MVLRRIVVCLLVKLLVGLLQVEEDLLSAFDGRSARDPLLHALQELTEQKLQLRLVLAGELGHGLRRETA